MPAKAARAQASPSRRPIAIAVIAVLCFDVGIVGGLLLRAARLPEPVADARANAPKATSTDARKPSTLGASDSPNRLPSPQNRKVAEELFGQHFRSGYQNFQEERYSQAVRDFERATKIAPHLAEGHYYLGESYSKLLLSVKAETEYRKAVELMSDFQPAQKKLAQALYERGAHREAIELLTQMDKQAPNDAYIQGELAINYLALDQPQPAISLLEKYNSARPSDAWGAAQLGRAQELLGHDEAAEALYRKAIQQNRHLAIAHHWLGLLLARSDRQTEAEQALAEYDRLRKLQTTEHELAMALLQNPADLRTLIALADTRFELGKTDSAKQTLERAEAIAPGNQEVAQLRSRWRKRASSHRD
jgi:tetratricopeptide (TPR) repeat protein